jgi:quinol monooxygenase YgiN
MSGPFIFISKYRIKQGKLEDFKKYVKALVEAVEANEPRLIAFNLYANEDGTQASGIQVHPDAASMESHMQLLRETRIADSFEFLERNDGSIEVYGTPSGRVIEIMKQIAGSGVPVSTNTDHLGGFTRSDAS